MGKLISRIPGSRLLISSLPGSALRTHVESLKALPGKLDIKRHSPSILYKIDIPSTQPINVTSLIMRSLIRFSLTTITSR